MNKRFSFIFLEEAVEFIENLDKKSKEKVLYNLNLATMKNDKNLFKKLTDDIWEFRTLYNKQALRLFAFWDKIDKEDTLVVCTHGIVKKTQKIPKAEIEKSERLRKEYFEIKALENEENKKDEDGKS